WLLPHCSSDALNEVGGFLPFLQPHVRLAPVAALSFVPPHPLHFAADVEETDFVDLDLEELLDGVLDLDLVRVRIDLEGDDVGAGLAHQRRLLRHQRTADDLVRVHDSRASVSRCSASCERTM